MTTWRTSAAALEQIKTEELRALTQEESGRVFATMAADPDSPWISPERRAAAGLVEQQRLFMLSDEHPARHRRKRTTDAGDGAGGATAVSTFEEIAYPVSWQREIRSVPTRPGFLKA